jgi:myo-inositol 2-dehydrogenase/D-chiro-inositol 1-dehydrogenase
MRIGLVGYGGWGRVHASAIGRVEGLSLSGVVAGDDASARQAAHDLPGVPVHRTLDALLADSGVDLVDIVGPNHLHADMAVQALEAGKHVLLEKPMATTLADSERLVAAAERSGRHCGIVLQLRVSRQWARVRELIAEGAVGRMRFANLTLFRRPFGGGAGTSDAFIATLTFADGSYAVFTQCLAGFEHSLVLELACDQGAIRTWWSGAMDRTETPDFELKLKRAGAEVAEIVAVEKSGEVFELEEQLRRLLVDLTPLVSAREALPSQIVCLEIERALAERRAIPLRWP